MSLLNELRRRNVFRVGIAYAVVAWLVLQVADVMIDNIGAPDWLFGAILLVLATGFPLALIFAWAFELTPEGLKREKEVDRSRSIAARTGRKLDFAIIGLLVVALAYFIWESRFAERSPGSTIGPEVARTESAAPGAGDEDLRPSIAVLPFDNRSRSEADAPFVAPRVP